MDDLIRFIQSKFFLSKSDIQLIKTCFVEEVLPPKTRLLTSGQVEHYIYYISEGIVKGYQNIDGKIVVQHLVAENNVFTSLDSFTSETPSLDYFETVTDCKLLKISKSNFTHLMHATTFWSRLVKDITETHLSCKIERTRDFQTLTAKERYTKFLKQNPVLARRLSIDTIASFLGVAPQSLSRIRKQLIL